MMKLAIHVTIIKYSYTHVAIYWKSVQNLANQMLPGIPGSVWSLRKLM